MQALLALTIANLRSFTRDRAALFWTLAFPIMFVLLFGTIFAGGGSVSFKVGWVDQDGTPAAAQLRAAFGSTKVFELTDGTLDPMLAQMRTGDVNAVIVVPHGLGTVVSDPSSVQGPPLALDLYVDPSQTTQSQTITQLVDQVVAATNLAIARTPAVLAVASRAVQTQTLNGAAYYVPSILAMALMQLGIFSAIPLVEQREKHILKRLSATPLRRWNLVGSNILMRLTIAVLQAVLIVGIGVTVLGVTVVGSVLLVAGFVDPGRRDVHLHRLRHRVLRAHRGGRQRHDERGPVPAHVPVGHLLPHRAHARVPAAGRRAAATDLSRRCAPTGDGRRRAICPTLGGRAHPRSLDGGQLPHLGALLPLGVGPQLGRSEPSIIQVAPSTLR